MYEAHSLGVSHNLTWIVQSIYEDKLYKVEAKTKKEGELHVADLILQMLLGRDNSGETEITKKEVNNNMEKKNKITYSSYFSKENIYQYTKLITSDKIVFVDLENVNISDTDIKKYNDMLFIIISSKNFFFKYYFNL